MRKYLKSVLLLIAVTSLIFLGCKKEDDGLPITIVQTSTAFDEENGYTETGTFTTSGGLRTSGTFVMDIIFVADSFYCTNKLIAPEGTFTTNMKCSATTMTGSWKILSGDGRYKRLNGGGTLLMMFPPDVPPGALGVETLTGKIFFHH
jgi:hypothetical protein